MLEEVTRVRLCHMFQGLDPGFQSSVGVICDCTAMGTRLRDEDTRPRAHWNRDGAKGGKSLSAVFQRWDL